MNMGPVRERIVQYKGSFITLGQLTERLLPADYAELCAAVEQLIAVGLLRPVGSVRNNNGKVPPLRLKYRIIRAKEDDSAVLNEIRQLSTALNISGYLKKPALYRKHREFLLPLSDYLKKHPSESWQPMSKNERAFAVWNNEKQLDDTLCQSMLRFNDFDARLGYYRTPEPFFDYLAGGRIGAVLISENKDTWYTLRRLFLQFPEKRRLFGVLLDGVVLGEGRKAARPHAMEEYAALLPGAAPRFYYFGDLDYAGIDIFWSVTEQNPSLSVSLFLPAYRAMLRRGREIGYGRARTGQAKPAHLADFLSLFAPEEAAKMEKLLAEGRYLPQEILSSPYLERQMTESEDHDA